MLPHLYSLRSMKISHGLWKLNLLVTCLGLGGALPLLPQNSPPLPPAPPPPTKRIGPPLRPVPLRTEGDAAKPAAAVAPVPVPLVAPALATPKPLLPSPVLAPIPASVPPANPGALVFDAEQKEY